MGPAAGPLLAGLFAVLPLILTYWIISFVYNLVNGPATA